MLDLKWNDKNKEILKKRFFDQKDDVKVGAGCLFIPLTKKVGAKLFFDKRNRDISHKRQKKIENFNLAPKTGDCFSFHSLVVEDISGVFGNAGKRQFYGYLTEVANVVDSLSLSEKSNLRESLEHLDIEYRDLRPCNVGMIGKKLVLIDFDYNSMFEKG